MLIHTTMLCTPSILDTVTIRYIIVKSSHLSPFTNCLRSIDRVKKSTLRTCCKPCALNFVHVSYLLCLTTCFASQPSHKPAQSHSLELKLKTLSRQYVLGIKWSVACRPSMCDILSVLDSIDLAISILSISGSSIYIVIHSKLTYC